MTTKVGKRLAEFARSNEAQGGGGALDGDGVLPNARGETEGAPR